uniref:serine/threonine-protein phosphatase with EF-hands 1-like n=1 Tax=Panthera onca TaxID=9690 RepID=UPI002955A9F4
NGLPSGSNSYIFNGDFVDRGRNSIEILMILFVSFLVYPNDLHLNRGNHEDFMMNLRYGFTKEILCKYKIHGKQILQILEDVYTWLPIGTIIDNEILVIHGGISESTDLNLLHHVERHKVRSSVYINLVSEFYTSFYLLFCIHLCFGSCNSAEISTNFEKICDCKRNNQT